MKRKLSNLLTFAIILLICLPGCRQGEGNNGKEKSVDISNNQEYLEILKKKYPDAEYEIRDGKIWANYPELIIWENQKLRVTEERNNHPGTLWWPEAGLGLFMHWGIVSAYEPTGEAWCVRWTQAKKDAGRHLAPPTEIWAMAETWNPENYDPEKWMEAASKAGFRYAVLTSKHHDGYALWDSDVALLNSGKYMNRDLLQPYVDACRNNDMKVGFYYSGMDWYYEREYMNWSFDPDIIMNEKHEVVSSRPEHPEGFREEFKKYNAGQVNELISRYDPDIWWGDGGHGLPASEIRELRPGIVVNNRGDGGDHVTSEGFHMSKPKYIEVVRRNGWWWEVNSIITRGSWHYDQRTEEVNSTEAVLYELAKTRCMGGNLLANIGPRPDGTLPDQAYRLFSEMADWMEYHSKAVFEIDGGGPWPEKSNVPITCKDRTWYLFPRPAIGTTKEPIELYVDSKPTKVELMRNGEEIAYSYEDGLLNIVIPDNLRTTLLDVLIMTMPDDFDPIKYKFTHW
ncbi:alpha-L-fucosidase [Bacteroidota bacterium]